MRWTRLRPVRRARRRSPVFDILVLATQGYARHLASRNAALLAYYGFLTLFPLIMVATTVLGFVLQGDPELRSEIVESAVSQIPVLGDQILNQSGEISGSITALIVGLVSGLWGSTRAFASLQTALDDAWEVPIEQRPNLVVRRIHSLIGLLVIGGAQIATVTLTSIAGWADLGPINRVAIGVGVLAVNIAVVTTMFRYLSAAEVSWRMAWPGGVITGVAYTVLQLIGTQVVTRLLAGAHSVYGAFASVLAITGWLLIHAVVSLFAAEINAAIHARRLVPVEESLDVRPHSTGLTRLGRRSTDRPRSHAHRPAPPSHPTRRRTDAARARWKRLAQLPARGGPSRNRRDGARHRRDRLPPARGPRRPARPPSRLGYRC